MNRSGARLSTRLRLRPAACESKLHCLANHPAPLGGGGRIACGVIK